MIDEKALEVAARAALHRRIRPDWFEVKDGAWVLDHDKVIAETAITAYLQALSPGSTGEAEGWVLVPKEPTTKMLAAGQTAWLADPCRKSSTLYRAMLAAAGGREG